MSDRVIGVYYVVEIDGSYLSKGAGRKFIMCQDPLDDRVCKYPTAQDAAKSVIEYPGVNFRKVTITIGD